MLIDKLIQRIIKTQAPIVVGLDPRLSELPQDIIAQAKERYVNQVEAAAYAMYLFNVGIIDAIYDLVPAVKPQIAFYEVFGLHGLKAYHSTCEYAASKGLIVIADVKRGDIGSTSKAYADAFLGQTMAFDTPYSAFLSDFMTVNPYLGTDCLDAFVENANTFNKGIFTLIKTSNQSSGQIQDLSVDGQPLYEKVANIVENYANQRVGEYGYSAIGSVVGATYPEQAERLRSILKTSFWLVPGYGAQGGGGKSVIPCFDAHGLGAIVNSSRGIIFAYQNEAYSDNYKEAAKQAVIAMKNDINQHLKAAGKWYGDIDLGDHDVL